MTARGDSHITSRDGNTPLRTRARGGWPRGPAKFGSAVRRSVPVRTFNDWSDGLHAHDLFGERTRRHGLRRVAQHVMDQPQAFARLEPSATGPLWPNPSLFRREVWIEQPHGAVEMREIGTMLDDLLLQMAHHCSATARMAGRVASSKNAPETPGVVAAKCTLVS